MKKEFIEDLYSKLTEALHESILKEPNLTKRLAASLDKIRSTLQALKSNIEVEPFSTSANEIEFFKHTKPKFYALFIYELERYHIEINKPLSTNQDLLAYYHEELHSVQRFFRQNQFLYQYFRQGMFELDHLYFLREAKTTTIPDTGIFTKQDGFSTNCDYLFSKFVAYEQISNILLLRINNLSSKDFDSHDHDKIEKQKLTWTGDKVNIAELAYGLYYTGQINGGSCDVADIIKWLEDSLNLQMGSVHRKFIDIRRRKTISYTKFLDQMREAIHKRVEEDLEYKPNRGIKLQKPPFRQD